MASKLFEKIQKAFGTVKIKSIESFIADGELYVTSAFLGTYWAVTGRQITSYIKDGLPKSDKSVAGAGGVALFNLTEAITWRTSSVRLDKARSTEKGKQKSVQIPECEEDAKNNVHETGGIRPYNDSDAMEKHYKANIAEAKYLQEIGHLITIEESDKAGAEQAMIHKSWITQLVNIIPTLVENKTASECRDIIEHYSQEYRSQLELMANQIVKGDNSLDDIVNAVRIAYINGVSMANILKCIKDSK